MKKCALGLAVLVLAAACRGRSHTCL